jgi:hypothetical protein
MKTKQQKQNRAMKTQQKQSKIGVVTKKKKKYQKDTKTE